MKFGKRQSAGKRLNKWTQFGSNGADLSVSIIESLAGDGELRYIRIIRSQKAEVIKHMGVLNHGRAKSADALANDEVCCEKRSR